jgi:hypothetical protein
VGVQGFREQWKVMGFQGPGAPFDLADSVDVEADAPGERGLRQPDVLPQSPHAEPDAPVVSPFG